MSACLATVTRMRGIGRAARVPQLAVGALARAGVVKSRRLGSMPGRLSLRPIPESASAAGHRLPQSLTEASAIQPASRAPPGRPLRKRSPAPEGRLLSRYGVAGGGVRSPTATLGGVGAPEGVRVRKPALGRRPCEVVDRSSATRLGTDRSQDDTHPVAGARELRARDHHPDSALESVSPTRSGSIRTSISTPGLSLIVSLVSRTEVTIALPRCPVASSRVIRAVGSARCCGTTPRPRRRGPRCPGSRRAT
jgi:hypothetical protein